MTRLLVVDDHPAMRAGLVRLFDADPEIDVVGHAGSAEDALGLVLALQPDVAVVDIDLPGRSGADLAADLRNMPTRVLVFTAHAGRGFVRALVDAGAQGYVTKDHPESELVAAVKAVARGEARWLVPPSDPHHPVDSLSDRELDILTLLTRGLSNAEIAETLFVSESTVRNTLTVVYEKAGVTNARQAIAWATEHGIGRRPA